MLPMEKLYIILEMHYRIGNEDKARETYLQIIDLFPGTEKASKSEAFLEEMGNAE